MKLLITAAALVVMTGSGIEASHAQGRGRGQGNDRGASDAAARPAASVLFSQRDVTLIRTHYGNRYKNLPPGLQKKLARGGSLPPGWEKKIEALPAGLLRDLPPLGSNRRYGVYDGHAVIYDPLTHAILDIISLL
jgi:hypothetical protein